MQGRSGHLVFRDFFPLKKACPTGNPVEDPDSGKSRKYISKFIIAIETHYK